MTDLVPEMELPSPLGVAAVVMGATFPAYGTPSTSRTYMHCRCSSPSFLHSACTCFSVAKEGCTSTGASAAITILKGISDFADSDRGLREDEEAMREDGRIDSRTIGRRHCSGEEALRWGSRPHDVPGRQRGGAAPPWLCGRPNEVEGKNVNSLFP
jgi:hypothetical protein